MRKPIWALSLFFAVLMAASANADSARILRITMNDGTTKSFWVNQIANVKFTAVAEVVSSSSEVIASCSSKEETSSSSAKVASSSSTKVTSSSSAKASSSSSAKVASSSSTKASSSSSTKVASSSSKKASSSSSTKASSSSSKKASSSSSAKESSSSSQKKSNVIAVQNLEPKVMWDARQQTLLLLADRAGDARVTLLDMQGMRVGVMNFAVVLGFNSVNLSDLNLANGKYVLHIDLAGRRTHKVIYFGNMGK